MISNNTVFSLLLLFIGNLESATAQLDSYFHGLTFLDSDKGHHHHHERPEFCDGKDCPHFELKSNETDYQTRRYDAAAWVSTNVTGWRFETAAVRGYTRLFQYFNGANKDEKKFNLTTPVVTAFVPQNNFTAASQNFTLSFYLPDRYQEKRSPPKPTAEDVFRFCTPRGLVFVSNFTGVALEGTILQQAKTLADNLKRDGVDFVDDAFLFAAYSPPQQLVNRYNEVWFMEKRKDQDISSLEDLAAPVYHKMQGHLLTTFVQ
eukprot:jgi/Botrbrau1/8864/Bobra.50_2s0021.1